ncbi:UbiX family flavin prenyltransferase [Rhodoblastus sp. 17X3]|uniref:UbiX family flavin prenyltransferase n=1 Tax=Rhodoblastus sp. 17X3 TaxID=3047026 RepID=UPI0024B7BFA8|nr:UbiX family flavin prenyltransferase [Rhodoblastus sp. 17X3]MDI9847419.1 UbiX family flavin prenyltransferase [Rhodoblastus sp. 17X3]
MTHVVVGISGASGAAIGLRIVEILDDLGAETHLVVSRAAKRTLAEEVGPGALSRLRARARHWHGVDDIGASVASGSFPTRGMIVAPCSMRTLAAIAHCLADNLLVRAADVHLKERRKLVLVARETPLHLGHLRAMTAATEAGAIVMPPVPAFYLKPASIDDIVDQIARRAIDLLQVFEPVAAQWHGGLERSEADDVIEALASTTEQIIRMERGQ